jgi:plasmid stabilization system protein ParE
VPELDRDEIRELLFGEYRVIYRLDPKRIVVLTVRHGRRRWEPGEVEPEIE